MRSKYLSVLFSISILFMALSCVGCVSSETSKKGASTQKPLLGWLLGEQKPSKTSEVSTKPMPPQTYGEWVKKYGNSAPSATQTSARRSVSSASTSGTRRTSSAQPVRPAGPVYGQEIPASVYENTSYEDNYSYIIKGNKNTVYFSYADCPIGKKINSDVSAVLNQYNLYNSFYYVPDLKPRGSTISVICKNPATMDCIENYLYRNCTGIVCVFNPKQRRVVMISAERSALERELVKLKNW